MSRIKKWVVFALIGCLAYFVGYIGGQRAQNATPPPSEPSISAPSK